MKSFKKALGVVLALTLLFNVFAMSVSAAYPSDAVVELGLTLDKEVYAPGDEVIVTFNVKALDSLTGGIQIAGQYEIGYNSAVIGPISNGVDLQADHAYVPAAGHEAPFDNSASQVMHSSDLLGLGMSDIYAEDQAAYGWDSIIGYWVATIAGSEIFVNCENDAFATGSIKMKIADDAAPGTYTIGLNQYGYDNYNAYVSDQAFLGLYGTGADMGFEAPYDGYLYDCGTVTFTVGAGKIIFNEKAQHNTNLTTADVATLGFVGNFDKNDIGGFTFVEGSTTTLANVTAVGVTLDIAGIGSQTKTTDALYLKSGSVYNFRAILKDLDLAQYGDAKITATYFVTFLKDGTPTTEYSDPVEFTANGIING